MSNKEQDPLKKFRPLSSYDIRKEQFEKEIQKLLKESLENLQKHDAEFQSISREVETRFMKNEGIMLTLPKVRNALIVAKSTEVIIDPRTSKDITIIVHIDAMVTIGSKFDRLKLKVGRIVGKNDPLYTRMDTFAEVCTKKQRLLATDCNIEILANKL